MAQVEIVRKKKETFSGKALLRVPEM